MKVKTQNRFDIPEGVTVAIKNRIVTVKGKRGTLTKDLSHLKLDFSISPKLKTVTVTRWFGYKLDNATINTAISHIRNMCTGVTAGFRFKLRFASAHFPINVSVEKDVVEIRNFLGEKRVRRQPIPSWLKVYRTDVAKTKDELVVEGIDLEEVSKYCALMHGECAVKNKDIRKFLDGIYVQTKTNIEESN
eukprot:GILJ01006022.1.p1 GENE.GILJ01006022.1~~GILJ01006022.1.p1  ORF type:complete len:201 (+),score=43.95 GILJ01006022.1:34-603(+)